MVSPVPGGPTFPEQKKRGHKKTAGISGEIGINENDKIVGTSKDPSKSGGIRNSTNGGSNKSNNLNEKEIQDITYMNENGEVIDQESNTDRNTNTDIKEPVVKIIKRRRRRLPQDSTLPNAKSLSRSSASKKHYRTLAGINAFNVRRDGTKGRLIDLTSEQLLSVRATSAVSTYPGTVQGGVSNASGVHGSFCILSGGCTNHTAGEGAIHTRTVDMNANIFYRESKFREQRKKILRLELQKLKDALLSFEVGAGERIGNPMIVSQGDMGVKKRSRNTRTPPSFFEKRGLLQEMTGKKVLRKNISDENFDKNSQLQSKDTNHAERVSTGTKGAVTYPLKYLMTTSLNLLTKSGDEKKGKMKVESGQRQGEGIGEGEGEEGGDEGDIEMDVETSSEISETGEDGEGVEEIDWHWGDKEQKIVVHTKEGEKNVQEDEIDFASQETDDEELNENDEQNMKDGNDFVSLENQTRNFHRNGKYNSINYSDDEGDVAMVVGRERHRDQLNENNELETEDEADSAEGDEEEDGGEGEDDDADDIDRREEDEELEFQSYYRSGNNFEDENDNENDNDNEEDTADEVEEEEEEEEEMEDEVDVEAEVMEEMDDGDENNDRGGIFSIEDEQEEYSDSD